MFRTKQYASAPAESAVTMPNRSSTFATWNLPGTCKVAESRTKLFFKALVALNFAPLKVRLNRFRYARGTMMQPLSLSWGLCSERRPPRSYPDLTRSKQTSCRNFQQCCPATSFEELTNVRAVSGYSNFGKFAAIFTGLFKTCFVCRNFSVQCFVV